MKQGLTHTDAFSETNTLPGTNKKYDFVTSITATSYYRHIAGLICFVLFDVPNLAIK